MREEFIPRQRQHSHRVDSVPGAVIDRGSALTLTISGQTTTAHRGDTVASAMLADGMRRAGNSMYLNRPRGIFSAGVEEPNALVTVKSMRAGDVNESMLPAPVTPATHGLSVSMDQGLGVLDPVEDSDYYDYAYEHPDVLVVGAGPAGLAAARQAAAAGARVVLMDENAQAGGSLLDSPVEIDGKPGLEWVAEVVEELAANPDVLHLQDTTVFGAYENNYILAQQKRTHRLDENPGDGISKERTWHLRAQQVVLATGAHERPIIFANNDRPGIMLAGAIGSYLNRYGVLAGERIALLTTNDSVYPLALQLAEMGVLATVIDTRAELSPVAREAEQVEGLSIRLNSVVVDTEADRFGELSAIHVAELTEDNQLAETGSQVIAVDTLGVSGGFSPVVHLHSQRLGTNRWDENLQAFVPDVPARSFQYAGAVTGEYSLAQTLQDGIDAGAAAALVLGFEIPERQSAPFVAPTPDSFQRAIWLVPAADEDYSTHFVDLQRDQTVADILRAIGAGMHSVEHVKRYTSISTANDQGKTSAVATIGVMSQLLGEPVGDIGTTTFRAPYAPVSYVALAGRQRGDLFDPLRKTSMDHLHASLNAVFEYTGGEWRRPLYYPLDGESLRDAVNRETRAVREAVGMIDSSTLGKIQITGTDAAEFINRIYSNGFLKLPVGRGRYGVMLNVDGTIFDDGVTLREAEDRFLMHTSSGGAQTVLNWLENWHQTEWFDLDVVFTSVSEQLATVAVAGPKARRVLEKLAPELDLAAENFRLMDFRDTTLASGIPARVARVSFTGELSYEITVASIYGSALWQQVADAGAEYGITPYGLESQRVLRAEKAFIIVGQDTDGSDTPLDVGMSWVLSDKKDFLGKRSLQLPVHQSTDRRQLVGIRAVDKVSRVRDGAALVNPDTPEANGVDPVEVEGFVTGYYYSVAQERTFGLAMVNRGSERIGERLIAPGYEPPIELEITELVSYDPEGARANGEA